MPGYASEIIVTLCSGICGTDLELQRGYYNFTGIAGHEFVGEVVTQGTLFGKRIVSEINIGCGSCVLCAAGLRNHCASRKVIGIKDQGGAFAEYLVVPEDNIFVVPAGISNRHAVLIEPLAAALEILEQVNTGSLNRALVIGAGRLGILVAEVLASTGLEVSLLVRRQERLRHVGNSEINIMEQLNDSDFPFVVETSGQAAGFSTALAAIAARGTIVMKSTYDGQLALDASKIVVNELMLIGSRCGPFEKAIDWLQSHNLDHLVFSSHSFEDAEYAFTRARDPSIYKVVFEPERT
jgi:threonine dehydrogenase-like Zn-dependent dehydrogenase